MLIYIVLSDNLALFIPQTTSVTLVDSITLPKHRKKRRNNMEENLDTAMKFISRLLRENYKLELIFGRF